MKCPNCSQNKATKHKRYGVLPCSACLNKRTKAASKQIEFTTESIKQQRKEFAPDIIQPFRKGEISKEYINEYGAQAAKNLGATDKEIKQAKYTWEDLGYYKEGA